MAKTKKPKVPQNNFNQQAQALNQTQQNLLADFQECNEALGVLGKWLIKEIAEAIHWINRLQTSKRESFWLTMRANQRNAQISTGPVSAASKKRCTKNAWVHSLRQVIQVNDLDERNQEMAVTLQHAGYSAGQ